MCEHAALASLASEGARVSCCRCGEYDLAPDLLECQGDLVLPRDNLRGIALLSGWLRDHPGSTLRARDIPEILALRVLTVDEKADRILLHLARVFPCAGDRLEIYNPPEVDLVRPPSGQTWTPASRAALAAVGYCESYQEVEFLMNACLADHRAYLRREGGWMYPTQITPAGWARIDELRRVGGRGAVGFVAMWFGTEINSASAAIQRAIAAAGYEPVRMDELQHNNAIDDEILARIRGSKFVVADLTRHRGGVYFEAGFALGLGLPVIWLCREDDLAQVHFDNRQYNFIAWQPEALAELERRLRHRIEATLGRGPLATNQSDLPPREAVGR